MVLIVCAAVLLAGCQKSAEDVYGKRFNPEREKLGIPVITDDLVLYSDAGPQLDWADRDFRAHGITDKAIHATKQISLISRNQPRYELDVYYSGRRFPSPVRPGETEAE